MSDTVIVGILTFVASISSAALVSISNRNKTIAAIKEQSDKADAAIDKAVAVYAAKTDTRLDELTREVREHNNFAQKVPRMEKEIELIEKKLNM